MSAWRRSAYRAIRPLLFTVDPERVHHATLATLAVAGKVAAGRAACSFAAGVAHPEAASVELMGLRFRNRVGLGAGFDKDGRAVSGWAALGLGFVELGTVTPRPQAGNPRPRLFRLPHDAALINRMGFNNEGAAALARRIEEVRPRLPPGFVIGVNIGRSRDGDVGDYPVAARTVAAAADYLAINVSSPNTPGLRQLQAPAELRRIVEGVAGAAPERPLVVKLSSDLSDDERSAIVERLADAPVAGYVVSNTTVTRPEIRSRRLSVEVGGLSGRPLLPRTLRTVRQLAGSDRVVIASGGVISGADARRLLEAGADLVQLWTGLVYSGPGLIGEAVDAAAMMARP